MNATWQEVILNKCKIFLIFSIVLFSFGVVSAGDCPINEEDEYYINFSGIAVCNQEDQGFIDSINDNRFLLEYVNGNLVYNGDNFEVIVEDMSGQLSVSLERDSETFFQSYFDGQGICDSEIGINHLRNDCDCLLYPEFGYPGYWGSVKIEREEGGDFFELLKMNSVVYDSEGNKITEENPAKIGEDLKVNISIENPNDKDVNIALSGHNSKKVGDRASKNRIFAKDVTIGAGEKKDYIINFSLPSYFDKYEYGLIVYADTYSDDWSNVLVSISDKNFLYVWQNPDLNFVLNPDFYEIHKDYLDFDREDYDKYNQWLEDQIGDEPYFPEEIKYSDIFQDFYNCSFNVSGYPSIENFNYFANITFESRDGDVKSFSESGKCKNEGACFMKIPLEMITPGDKISCNVSINDSFSIKERYKEGRLEVIDSMDIVDFDLYFEDDYFFEAFNVVSNAQYMNLINKKPYVMALNAHFKSDLINTFDKDVQVVIKSCKVGTENEIDPEKLRGSNPQDVSCGDYRSVDVLKTNVKLNPFYGTRSQLKQILEEPVPTDKRILGKEAMIKIKTGTDTNYLENPELNVSDSAYYLFTLEYGDNSEIKEVLKEEDKQFFVAWNYNQVQNYNLHFLSFYPDNEKYKKLDKASLKNKVKKGPYDFTIANLPLVAEKTKIKIDHPIEYDGDGGWFDWDDSFGSLMSMLKTKRKNIKNSENHVLIGYVSDESILGDRIVGKTHAGSNVLLLAHRSNHNILIHELAHAVISKGEDYDDSEGIEGKPISDIGWCFSQGFYKNYCEGINQQKIEKGIRINIWDEYAPNLDGVRDGEDNPEHRPDWIASNKYVYGEGFHDLTNNIQRGNTWISSDNYRSFYYEFENRGILK